jgi:hypothetical protein
VTIWSHVKAAGDEGRLAPPSRPCAVCSDPTAAAHLREAVTTADEAGLWFVAGIARHTLPVAARDGGSARCTRVGGPAGPSGPMCNPGREVEAGARAAPGSAFGALYSHGASLGDAEAVALARRLVGPEPGGEPRP